MHETILKKTLNDITRSDSVMEYSKTNEIQEMWRYPVLISFLCLLVNKGDVDLEKEKLSLYELYEKLHECLYNRYAERENVTRNDKERILMFEKLGKIAFDGLIGMKTVFSRGFIKAKAGKEILEIGLLTCDTGEVTGILDDEVCVWFPHKTIQEFLAAKYFTSNIKEDETLNILRRQGPDFFLENLTFFAFALDRCNNTKSLQRKGLCPPWSLSPQRKLEKYILQQVNRQEIAIKGAPMPSRTCDLIITQIAKCNKTESLLLEKVRFGEGFDTIMKNTSSIKSLHLIHCSFEKYEESPDIRESSLMNIKVENSGSAERFKELLKKVTNTFNFPSLTTLQLCKVHLTAEHVISLSEGNSKGYLPVLKDLRLINCHQLAENLKELFHKKVAWKSLERLDCSSSKLHVTDLKALSEANVLICLPVLKHLGLKDNKRVGGNLQELFNKAWKSLEMLDCSDCELQVSDLISLSEANAAGYLPVLKHLRLGSNKQMGQHLNELFHETTPWKSLEMLDCSDCDLQVSDLISLSEAKADGHTPVLNNPESGYDWKLDNCDKKLSTSWRVVNLRGWNLQPDNLTSLSKANACGLMNVVEQLGLTDNRNISGHLHLLFNESDQWKCLEMLGCSNCYLQASDLEALSKANVRGHLPVLKHLGLGHNDLGTHISRIFGEQTPWQKLEEIACPNCNLKAADLISLSEANSAGYLPILNHLDLKHNWDLKGYFHELLHTESTWECLKILDWEYFTKAEAEFLLQVLQEGKFPKLRIVKCSKDGHHYVSEKLEGKLQKYVKFETN